MPLVIVASLRRAQFRWNTKHWTVYLSSKMLLALHLRAHDFCLHFHSPLSASPDLTLFKQKKKTLITLGCKKAHSWSGRIAYLNVDQEIFFLQSPCLTCNVLWKRHNWWAYLSLQLVPWHHFGRKHIQLYHSDLTLKAKNTPAFFLAKNQVQQYKDSPGAQSAV